MHKTEVILLLFHSCLILFILVVVKNNSVINLWNFVCVSLESIKSFLTEFCESNENGAKFFKYAGQLTTIAHREQVNV